MIFNYLPRSARKSAWIDLAAGFEKRNAEQEEYIKALKTELAFCVRHMDALAAASIKQTTEDVESRVLFVGNEKDAAALYDLRKEELR